MIRRIRGVHFTIRTSEPLPLFARLPVTSMNPLNPKKLLLTKWTAVTPLAKQKHFLVSRVIKPELPTEPIELVEIESVFSQATQVIPWRDLQNEGVWRQGWER